MVCGFIDDMRHAGAAAGAVAEGTARFIVPATPTDASKVDWPVLEIDERRQVAER